MTFSRIGLKKSMHESRGEEIVSVSHQKHNKIKVKWVVLKEFFSLIKKEKL